MNILVVDDEQDVKTLFEQRFRREIRKGTIDFQFAFSGSEALEKLNEVKKKEVLILSDINMPGMTGLELLAEIRKSGYDPNPVVMIISAYGDAEIIELANKLGANEFLTKPLNFNYLKEKLNSYQ